MKEFLDTLKRLRQVGPMDTDLGICHNVSMMLGYDVYYECDKVIKALGLPAKFPVEGDDATYVANKSKWDEQTEHGKARWKLLDDMIKYLEKRVHGN